MSEKIGGRAVENGDQNKLGDELKAIVQDQTKIPESIVRADLAPRDIETGETEIIFQRHGKYERDENAPNKGSLTPEAQQDEYDSAKKFFQLQLEAIPADERSKVNLLVIASDTQYLGQKDAGKRSTETANLVLKAARDVLNNYGLSEDQILNDTTNVKGNGEARPAPILREPKAFDESPEFIEFLKDKYERNTEYGEGSKFWQAFEGDWEKEKREEMGAEGPDEMADRLQKSFDILARYSKFFHQKHPESRLIVWAASHYDTISPFVKRELMRIDKDKFLGVDYGAGISIKLNRNGSADTIINAKTYKVPTKG